MGCLKLDTDFFNFLEVERSEKSDCEEKKRVNYYPFGLEHKGYNNVVNGTENQWKYQGKEHEEELGLNTYDFGARNYMPDLGRWTTVDPLAEDTPSWSPYVYVHNNPINMIDPDGRKAFDWYENLESGNVEYYEGSEEIDGYKNIGPSTNLVTSQGDNAQSFSLNEDGSFSNMDSGRTYNKGESLTTNNGTEIKSNLTRTESISQFFSDNIARPLVETPQQIGAGIINQMDRGLMLLTTGEDKADTNNYLIQNTYNFDNWSLTKGRNTYSTGRPNWEEGKRMINNTLGVIPFGVTTKGGKAVDWTIENIVVKPLLGEGLNQLDKK